MELSKRLGNLSKKSNSSNTTIGLNIDGEVCFDKIKVQKNLIRFIQLLHLF